MTDQQIPLHPLLAHLTHEGTVGAPETPVKFSGYVGRASQEGLVRLYSTLDDLSYYLEFDHGAIVQTADAPESILPNQAVTIWVKPRTHMRWIHEYSTATAVLESILTRLGMRPPLRWGNPGSLQ